MDARADKARRDVGILAICLTAWHRGEAGVDGEVGAHLIAETVAGLRKHIGFKDGDG